MEGVSSHGMEPDNGKNAGLYLAAFLSKLPLAVYFYISMRSRLADKLFGDRITRLRSKLRIG